MAPPTSDERNSSENFLISMSTFQIVMWTFAGLGTFFLATRLAIRLSAKGRLMLNDYFLVAGLPIFIIGASLIQSVMRSMYRYEQHAFAAGDYAGNIDRRLPAAIETLWITIYCVKFCFLAQFKFHKSLYAYVSVHLTRYYWAVVCICSVSFIVSLVQPIVLCPKSDSCRYFQATDTAGWETTVTSIDILTDMLVISIPILLVYMANFARSHTIINASFKSLSIFSVAIASTRLALQYDNHAHRVDYVVLVFFLFIEAAIALIMASISSYRAVVLDQLAEWTKHPGANVMLTAPQDLSRTALNPEPDASERTSASHALLPLCEQDPNPCVLCMLIWTWCMARKAQLKRHYRYRTRTSRHASQTTHEVGVAS